LDSTGLAVIIALATSGILCSGKYTQIERVMLALVSLFTLSALASLVSMQFTPFRVSWPDLAQGFQFQFPLEYLVLALAVYGATGVNSAELSAYPYWCIEKGYASFIGAENNNPERIGRARGWIRVMQTDVWITVIILTCATVPFYLLGAGVLHGTGQVPAGIDSLLVLSEIFTRNLGPGTVWLFGVTAFCILFSSCIAGFGGIARLVPDYLVEFGLLDRRQHNTRLWWTRATGMLAPMVGLISYLLQNNPIFLLSIGALAGALLLPIQSGSTLWLQGNRMTPEFRPALSARVALWMTFLFQAALAILIIWFVVFRTS
jgi:Mn2+/Fe2+ NRAMP family transporter